MTPEERKRLRELADKADGPIIKQAMSFAIVLWDELEKEK